jgi:hypothetical protein
VPRPPWHTIVFLIAREEYMQAAPHDKVLDKIRKLLAMAERGNSPHEQRIARRQAEALMRRYGIDPAEVLGASGPGAAEAVWGDSPDGPADPDDPVKTATPVAGVALATIARWVVRVSWLLILFMPVSELVVSAQPPTLPNPLQLLAAAWTDSGLLAAVFALVIGAVGVVIVTLWWAFWAFSHVMHAVFWELIDWSKFAMGPDLWHIPIAAALGALVAFVSGQVFGYDGRRVHPVIVYTGLTAVVMVVVAAMLMLSGRTEDDR